MISIVVLGHKDHGKSTLLGRLLYETNSVHGDRIEEIQKFSKNSGKKFEWAHLLDSFRYEREHEMTLDTTRATVKLGNRLYEFIDVPGHKELIQNMLTGASHARYAVVVVDCIEGIKQQTIEHIGIAYFLGIRSFVVAINKLDRVDAGERVFSILTEKVKNVFKKYHVQPVVIPLIAYQGGNVLKKTPLLKWFRGSTLAQVIQRQFRASLKQNRSKRSFIFSVQDVYGRGQAVGRSEQGGVKKGDSVFILQHRYHVKKITANADGVTDIVFAPLPVGLKRGDIITTTKGQLVQKISLRCIFLKKPTRRNLFLIAGFKKVKVVALNGKNLKLRTPATCSVELEGDIVPLQRMVLQENNAIVGVCTVDN